MLVRSDHTMATGRDETAVDAPPDTETTDDGTDADANDPQTTASQPVDWHQQLSVTSGRGALGLFDDAFAGAAQHVGVDHPGAALVETLAQERVDAFQDQLESCSLPTAGSLTLTLNQHLAPDHRLTVDEDCPSPTAIQATLFDADGELTTALVDALKHHAANADSALVSYFIDAGVTALDGVYARLATQAIIALARGQSPPVWKFLAVSQHLGGQIEGDLNSSLDDIRTGPVALLATTDSTPTVEIELERGFFEANSTLRERFINHLVRLMPGVDIRLVGTRTCLRQLLDAHGDQLPTSVSENAKQSLRARPTARSLTAERAARAQAALDQLGREHPAWAVLAALADARREQRAYSDLYDDERFDVSASAIRRRLGALRDVDCVTSTRCNGAMHATLTPVGHAALVAHPSYDVGETRASPTSSRPGWAGSRDSTADGATTATTASVTDPRNSLNSTVCSSETGGGRGQSSTDRPAEADGHTDADTAVPTTKFLSTAEHHALTAAAADGHIALLERSVPAAERDRRQPRFSFDSARDELIASVDYSPCLALTAVRLCAALLSDPAFDQVLTEDRLAGQSTAELGGLAVSDILQLRDGACLGWLPDGITAAEFRTRLQQAKRGLLRATTDLTDDTGQVDGAVARTILKEAHGLMGVATRVYDFLGVDIVRELRFPRRVPTDTQRRRDLQRFLATASSIGGRYDIYSAYRVLHEGSESNREQLLSTPAVDPHDPVGTLLGAFVLTGTGAADFEDALADGDSGLTLQQDATHYAPFVLNGDIIDASRRSAIGEAATRVLVDTDGLGPDRQALSVLAALAGDVVTAATALTRLGGEDEPRRLDMQDVRYGLSTIPADRIVPELGGQVVSKVIAALIDSQEPLTTAALATRAGCSQRALTTASNAQLFAELEAAGLLQRTQQGPGQATLWRLRMPFRRERHDSEPLPTMLTGRVTGPLGGEWHLSDALCAVLTTAHDSHGITYPLAFNSERATAAFTGPPDTRQLQPLLNRLPQLRPLSRLLAMLLDQPLPSSTPSSLSLGEHPYPAQQALTEVDT